MTGAEKDALDRYLDELAVKPDEPPLNISNGMAVPELLQQIDRRSQERHLETIHGLVAVHRVQQHQEGRIGSVEENCRHHLEPAAFKKLNDGQTDEVKHTIWRVNLLWGLGGALLVGLFELVLFMVRGQIGG